MRTLWFFPALVVVGITLPGTLGGQERPELRIQPPEGAVRIAPLTSDRGFMALEVTELRQFGWGVVVEEGRALLDSPDGTRVEVRAGTPFFRWADQALQLANAPYMDEARLLVPLQLVADFIPRRLPDQYRFDGPSLTLRVVGVEGATGLGPVPVEAAPLDPRDAMRVVVIDAGHGGNDPGALGLGNLREKTVALGIALALAEELREDEGLELHLIRDGDDFVDLWERGAIATELKGERPGVFISIHANSFPARRSVRGFETYFLSDARTDDERRVAAIENAPLRLDNSEVVVGDDLEFILRDLGNLDHQHWSSELAQMVQEELATFHPGPNRGVKQGPLAVITNALMPAVLIEIGYLSHREEGPLLGSSQFQRESARAVARAIRTFFGRYPPGPGGGEGGGA
jgi:N-acetylmuramoyl-L-alanine amidase